MSRGKKFWNGMREFTHWLSRLFHQPLFLFVTFFGHASIFFGALTFWFFERHANAHAASFFNCYYWAISLATTVGSADISPITVGGKLAAIFLMVAGALFLWSYAALFAASVVLPTVTQVGREVKELEADVTEMEKEVRVDKATLEKLLLELERLNKSGKS